MSTIIAHNFLTMHKVLEPNLAGLLLGAILSDTLNLQSPTSTDMDALMVGVLSKISGVQDPNQYAKEQFKAKSAEIDAMSHQLLTGDLKKFVCNGVKVGFGVVETTDPEAVLARQSDLLSELPHVKKEKDFDVLFFAIVDIVNMKSNVLLCGPREIALAEATFEGCPHECGCMDTGDRVSRKKQFVPPLTSSLNEVRVDVKAIPEVPVEEGMVLVMHENSNGCIVRVSSSKI
jgi:manganese-dependent inorganic pyrophosphatase